MLRIYRLRSLNQMLSKQQMVAILPMTSRIAAMKLRFKSVVKIRFARVKVLVAWIRLSTRIIWLILMKMNSFEKKLVMLRRMIKWWSLIDCRMTGAKEDLKQRSRRNAHSFRIIIRQRSLSKSKLPNLYARSVNHTNASGNTLSSSSPKMAS